MKLTVAEVVTAFHALNSIAQEKMPPKGGYWIARLAKKLEPEFSAAEERRVALVKEYGEKQEDGNIRVANGNAIQFAEKWAEILKQEIEVDCPTIRLEVLGDAPIKAADVVALEKFIEEK